MISTLLKGVGLLTIQKVVKFSAKKWTDFEVNKNRQSQKNQ